MEAPRSVVIDFHGTLTDGKKHMASDGKTMFESVHTRDIRAIRELTARGYEVYICTASSSSIVDSFCRMVGAEKIMLREKTLNPNDKRLTFPYYAIGDDVWDVPLFKGAEKTFCPADADPEAILQANVVLKCNGGQGVVAEFIRVELW